LDIKSPKFSPTTAQDQGHSEPSSEYPTWLLTLPVLENELQNSCHNSGSADTLLKKYAQGDQSAFTLLVGGKRSIFSVCHQLWLRPHYSPPSM